ncbi:hypothetical protein C0569_20510 [Priestia megaterium]|nr:hypothetical protein C0569_20510 [Priestia megaterium]
MKVKLICSIFKGKNGQWWSIYRLNIKKYGPWALEISYIKFSIAVFISLAIVYIVSFGFKRKR